MNQAQRATSNASTASRRTATILAFTPTKTSQPKGRSTMATTKSKPNSAATKATLERRIVSRKTRTLMQSPADWSMKLDCLGPTASREELEAMLAEAPAGADREFLTGFLSGPSYAGSRLSSDDIGSNDA